MSSVVISGDTSGAITLAAPAVSGTNTLTLPALTGTVLTNKTAGTVLQVVSTTKTDTFSTTSTSFTDVTGLSASITPTSSSSKIFVIVNVALGAGNIQTSARLMRDATAISIGDTASNRVRASSVNVGNTTANSTSGMPLSTAINYLDSPASTSSITYKIQIQVSSGTGYVNRADDDQDATFRARTASTITVMEIAA